MYGYEAILQFLMSLACVNDVGIAGKGGAWLLKRFRHPFEDVAPTELPLNCRLALGSGITLLSLGEKPIHDPLEANRPWLPSRARANQKLA